MKKIYIFIVGIAITSTLFMLASYSTVSAQACAGFTRCGVKDIYENCDFDRDFLTGCGNSCNPDGCSGCVIVSSCAGAGAGGGGTSCTCGTKADGSCKACNSGYVYPTCASGTTLLCGTPSVVTCVKYIATCAASFPSKFWPGDAEDGTSCNPSSNNASYCQTNCGCCTATETYINGQGCVSTTPTCTVDVVPQTIPVGTSALFPASVPASSGAITQVNFVSSNPAVATVTTPDTTPSYGTTATTVSAGTTNITASVVMSGSVRCTDTATLTVTNTSAWWQVRDGDVTTLGNLRSAAASWTII